MTILCAGCSWTFGLGVDSSETYPAHLQNYTNQTVINAGSCGVDIPYTLWSIRKLLDKYNPSVVILQLTTLDRMTFATDGKRNFINQIHYDDSRDNNVYTEGKDYKRITSIGNFAKEHITVGSYTESLKRNSDKDVTIKTLFENSVYDNYNTEIIAMQLESFYAFLQSKNIELIMFPWLSKFGADELVRSLPYHKESVQEFLRRSNRETYIDNGFHTGDLVNKFIAEEYVYPLIKDLTTTNKESSI
jgi:hypothetical protein